MTDTSRMAEFYPMTETGYLAFYARRASAKNLAEIGREVGYAQSSAGKKVSAWKTRLDRTAKAEGWAPAAPAERGELSPALTGLAVVPSLNVPEEIQVALEPAEPAPTGFKGEEPAEVAEPGLARSPELKRLAAWLKKCAALPSPQREIFETWRELTLAAGIDARVFFGLVPGGKSWHEIMKWHAAQETAEWLEASAIAPSQQVGVTRINSVRELPADLAQWETAVPGYCFEWRSFDGRTFHQLRPDNPPRNGNKSPKYVVGGGCRMALGVPPGFQDLVADKGVPLVIVEGTKQHRAVASALAGSSPPYAVVGLNGCHGWLQDKRPLGCFHKIPLEDRQVFLVFDADLKSNAAVYGAAEELASTLRSEFLAGRVKHVISTRSGKDGIDDLLAGHPSGRRQRILLKLLDEAQEKLPRKPRRATAMAPTPAGQFFGADDNFLAEALWEYLKLQHPMAVTREVSTEKALKGAIAVYEAGVYMSGQSRRFNLSVTRALGDRYRLVYTETVAEIALNELTYERAVIPERMDRLLVNCRNGLVDVMTGELLPHDPGVLTTFQVPHSYDPDAKCPKYEAWLEERLPGQMEALEDLACQVLDMTRTPQRFLFLFGDKRTGKSTYLRVMTEMVGAENRSSVSLHQLSDDRFASANLYGKVLNVAADLSSSEVRDLSNLKMVTGEDSIHANRKYGAQFSFTNQALLAFSANEVPTVSDPSGAYQARAIPFHFANSFAGREKPEIELELLKELPGILARFIRALRAHRERGHYIGTDARTREDFKRQSNRVQEFLDEMTRPVEKPHGIQRAMLWESWKAWVAANGYQQGGRNKFFAKVRSCGLEEFKPKGGSVSFPVEIIDPDRWDGDEGLSSWDEGGSSTEECPAEAKSGEATPTGAGPSDCNDPGVMDGRLFGTFEGGSAGKPRPPYGGHKPSGGGDPRGEFTEGDSTTTVCGPLRPGLLKSDESAEKRRPPMVFDLETCDANLLFAPGARAFVRLTGYTGDESIETSASPDAVLAHTGPLVAHNGFGFDFLALARHHGFDLLQAGERGRLIDTMVLASLALPPEGGQGGKAIQSWGLDVLGQKILGRGKFVDANALAKKHGGFDKIQVDDPDYVDYCRNDVFVTQGLFERFCPEGRLTTYQQREMRLMTRLTAGISLNGFRVDEALVHERIAEGQRVKDEGRQWLVETYGLPTTTSDGKPAKNPLSTAAGKKCVADAFQDMGVMLPTSNAGGISTSSETMTALIKSPDSSPEVVRLAEVVTRMNGVRSVYQTVLDHLQGDRVHPSLFPSMKNARFDIKPGMTVLGKKGVRVQERAVFLPDSDDHVLIAADLSQIDARAVAAHCQDPAYMDLFEIDPATGMSRDIHSEVAIAIWGDTARRKDAKAINHGINYGMGAERLSDSTGLPYEDASVILSTFWNRFPVLRAWQGSVREQGKAGQPLHNGFGRKFWADPEKAYTQAPALVGCGTARDLMAEGILRLPLELVPMLRMFVHDELVFSVPKDDAQEIEAAILSALQFEWAPYEGARPIEVVAELGSRGLNWAEVYLDE